MTQVKQYGVTIKLRLNELLRRWTQRAPEYKSTPSRNLNHRDRAPFSRRRDTRRGGSRPRHPDESEWQAHAGNPNRAGEMGTVGAWGARRCCRVWRRFGGGRGDEEICGLVNPQWPSGPRP